MMSAVLALGVLSGAASAVPQTEEAAVSEEQTDDSAFAESAADLVSGESMVYLPSGMRAVMLTPTVDFYTGEQTDASLAEELPALFEELSGFDMNTVIFNTDHDGVKCYDLEMDSGRGALGAAIDSAHENGFNAYVQLDVGSLIDDVTAQGGGLKSGFAAAAHKFANPAGELLH